MQFDECNRTPKGQPLRRNSVQSAEFRLHLGPRCGARIFRNSAQVLKTLDNITALAYGFRETGTGQDNSAKRYLITAMQFRDAIPWR
jgi:hypothetical protein